MGYFDTERGIEEYIEMAKGFDGAQLIDVLRGYLPAGSTILELGMGPGVDLDLLARTYVVTGSDYSQLFLDRYRSRHPDADLMLLDAATPSAERCFDCIYSNKVLHHLMRGEVRASLTAQCGLLNVDGLAMHSFWWGDKEDESMEGLRFVYYTEETLAGAVADSEFETVELRRYSEMESDDSILVLLRKLKPYVGSSLNCTTWPGSSISYLAWTRQTSATKLCFIRGRDRPQFAGQAETR